MRAFFMPGASDLWSPAPSATAGRAHRLIRGRAERRRGASGAAIPTRPRVGRCGAPARGALTTPMPRPARADWGRFLGATGLGGRPDAIASVTQHLNAPHFEVAI
jgi:hypothetical protein